MNTEQDIEEINVSIAQAEEVVRRKDALVRLTNNPDFKLIVREGYFEKEASRLVLLKADPTMQDPEGQRQIDNNITAVGYFRLYLHTIMQLGNQMEAQISEDKKTREELHREAD